MTENNKKEFKNYISNYIEDRNRKYELVKSEEYLNWIETFSKKFNHFTDETWSYKKEEIEESDYKNVEILSSFFYYVSELADEQNILPIYQYGDDETYFFKLKDTFFEICTIVGQGAFTSLHRLENFNIKTSFVKIDEELTEDELKNRELIQYIIINKDYIGKIDSAKFGVHIGHACTICAIEESPSDKFKKWYKNGKLQKKIVLTTSTKKLEELEKQFYSVRDLGFTEVEKGTLLAVSLGIMTREQAKPYIKRMQVWKDFKEK